MLKTYAPKGLHGAMLRELLDDLQATPADAAKFLRVTERSIWRWLADDSAPFAALAALWHETPTGRHVTALDVGNEVVIYRGLAGAHEKSAEAARAQLAKLVAIGDFGCANDPVMSGPPPGGGPKGFAPGPRYPARVLRSFKASRVRRASAGMPK